MASTLNILSKLKELNDSNLISIYIPSLKKEVEFKQLSVKQQKDLMKSGLDGTMSGLTLSNTITDIIIDNAVDTKNFLITDRMPIILALRKQSFGSVAVIKSEDSSKEYNLDTILSRKLEYTLPYQTTISSKDNLIEIELKVADLSDDRKVNEYQLSLLKKKKDDIEISDAVGSMFVFEVCKFVSKLTINGEESDIKSFSVKDRGSIVENIAASVNSQILSYLQSFRQIENDYLTIDGEILPIDARLFSKE